MDKAAQHANGPIACAIKFNLDKNSIEIHKTTELSFISRCNATVRVTDTLVLVKSEDMLADRKCMEWQDRVWRTLEIVRFSHILSRRQVD